MDRKYNQHSSKRNRKEMNSVWISNFGKRTPGKHIHHLDGDAGNNSPDNLIEVSREMHRKFHQDRYNELGLKQDYYAAQLLGGVEGTHPGGCAAAGWNKGLPAPWATNTDKANCREVLNTETGIFYQSISEAARSIGWSAQRLKRAMNFANVPISPKRPNTKRKQCNFIYI